MTWTASSDLSGFFATGTPASGASDLRSLIHQELRLLAYFQPTPPAEHDASPQG